MLAWLREKYTLWRIRRELRRRTAKLFKQGLPYKLAYDMALDEAVSKLAADKRIRWRKLKDL